MALSVGRWVQFARPRFSEFLARGHLTRTAKKGDPPATVHTAKRWLRKARKDWLRLEDAFDHWEEYQDVLQGVTPQNGSEQAFQDIMAATFVMPSRVILSNNSERLWRRSHDYGTGFWCGDGAVAWPLLTHGNAALTEGVLEDLSAKHGMDDAWLERGVWERSPPSPSFPTR